MKAVVFKGDEKGTFEERDAPDDMKEAIEAARAALVEMVAEGDDALMEKYFEAGELSSEELLSGSLEELDMSVPLAVALPPPQDRALSDIWSALGGELKPSIDVSIIAPLLPDVVDDVGPPVTEEPILTLVDQTTGASETIGGRAWPEHRRRGISEIGRPPPALDDPRRIDQS